MLSILTDLGQDSCTTYSAATFNVDATYCIDDDGKNDLYKFNEAAYAKAVGEGSYWVSDHTSQ